MTAVSVEEVIMCCLTTINKDIEEAERTNFGQLKEVFFDELSSKIGDGEDPDGFDLIFSKNPPKDVLLVSNTRMNRSEIYVENPFGAELPAEAVKSISAVLPKHTKYIWSDKEHIAFQTSKFKRMRAYLVPKPGYKGPVVKLPETELAKLSNGYGVFALLDPDEIKTEGRALNHCVGRNDMGYIDRVEKGEIQLYSIRDPKNNSLFTVEANGKQIIQVKGLRNRLPGFGNGADTMTKQEEVNAILEWFEQMGVDSSSVSDLRPALNEMKKS